MIKPNQPKNRILIALYYYHPYVSGLSVLAKRIAEGLAATGYDVTVLTSRHDKSLPRNEIINGVTVIRRPVLMRLNKGLIMPFFWFDIVKNSLKSDYVNLHLPMADSGISVLFIPRRKIVATYHCDLNLGEALISRLIAFISMASIRLQLSRSRVVVPTTRDYLEHSKMRSFIAKASPIYPTINAEEFYPDDPKPLFRKLGIGNEIKIGFVGRVVYEKGIDYLLEAIPYLEQLGNFKIIIVGDYQNVAGGSTRDQLERYIREYPERIIFTGFLDDADRGRFYSGIDVLALPSIDPLEAFGMVQIEAMLCGAPVVASDLPGVREVVRQTGFGKLCKVKDPQDIARQIVEVVSYPKRFKPNRDKVLKHFNSEFTISAYAKLMPKRPSHLDANLQTRIDKAIMPSEPILIGEINELSLSATTGLIPSKRARPNRKRPE